MSATKDGLSTAARKFIDTACAKGFQRRNAENAWVSMVQIVNGANYSHRHGLKVMLTLPQQKTVLSGGPNRANQRRRIPQEQWQIIEAVLSK